MKIFIKIDKTVKKKLLFHTYISRFVDLPNMLIANFLFTGEDF